MKFTVGNSNAKEDIDASSQEEAFDKFVELHPEEIYNALFLVYEVTDEN